MQDKNEKQKRKMKKTLVPKLDITRRHPKGIQSATDMEYARVATEVMAEMEKLNVADIPKSGLKEIAVYVALYFEDVVADAGIWRSFTERIKELYGRQLPFYDVDAASYFPDEPNEEDVKLLIWYTMLDVHYGKIGNPENEVLGRLAHAAYGVLERNFETVSVNEELKEYFQKADFVADYYSMRDAMKWLLYDCYLTYVPQLEERVASRVEEAMYKLGCNPREAFYHMENILMYEKEIGPLELPAQDWMAMILRANGHQEAADRVAAQKYSRMTSYKILGSDDNGSVTFEATDGRQFTAAASNLNVPTEECYEKKCVFGSFVEYGGEMFANGGMKWSDDIAPFDEAHKDHESKERLHSVYDKLVADNGGSRLFHFADSKELKKFLIEKFPAANSSTMANMPMDQEKITLYVPENYSDIQIYPQGAYCVKDGNPFYNEKWARNQALNFALSVSPELRKYLISHGLLPDATINSSKGVERGNEVVQQNFDFLGRAVSTRL